MASVWVNWKELPTVRLLLMTIGCKHCITTVWREVPDRADGGYLRGVASPPSSAATGRADGRRTGDATAVFAASVVLLPGS